MRGPLLERMPPFEGSRLRASQSLVTPNAIPNGIDQSPEESSVGANASSSNANESVRERLGPFRNTIMIQRFLYTIARQLFFLLKVLFAVYCPSQNALLDLLGGIDSTEGPLNLAPPPPLQTSMDSDLSSLGPNFGLDITSPPSGTNSKNIFDILGKLNYFLFLKNHVIKVGRRKVTKINWN